MNRVKITNFDVAAYLDDKEAVVEYLSQILVDGDIDELLEVTGYIAKDEARARVSVVVEEYRSGKMKTVPYSQGMDKIDNWLNNL